MKQELKLSKIIAKHQKMPDFQLFLGSKNFIVCNGCKETADLPDRFLLSNSQVITRKFKEDHKICKTKINE